MQKILKPDIIPLQGQYLHIYRHTPLSHKGKKGQPKEKNIEKNKMTLCRGKLLCMRSFFVHQTLKIEGFGREASPNREKLYERLLKNPRFRQNKEVCPLGIKGILNVYGVFYFWRRSFLAMP